MESREPSDPNIDELFSLQYLIRRWENSTVNNIKLGIDDIYHICKNQRDLKWHLKITGVIHISILGSNCIPPNEFEKVEFDTIESFIKFPRKEKELEVLKKSSINFSEIRRAKMPQDQVDSKLIEGPSKKLLQKKLFKIDDVFIWNKSVEKIESKLGIIPNLDENIPEPNKEHIIEEAPKIHNDHTDPFFPEKEDQRYSTTLSVAYELWKSAVLERKWKRDEQTFKEYSEDFLNDHEKIKGLNDVYSRKHSDGKKHSVKNIVECIRKIAAPQGFMMKLINQIPSDDMLPAIEERQNKFFFHYLDSKGNRKEKEINPPKKTI